MNRIPRFYLSTLVFVIVLMSGLETNQQAWGQTKTKTNLLVQNDLVTHELPDWIKKDAKLWVIGKETDKAFVHIIQYLIKEKIIIIDVNMSSTTLVHIPSWLKFNAAWLGYGYISDDDFVGAIQFLITKGILTIPLESDSINSEPPNSILYNKGWDPTFSKRRIAAIHPSNESTYFESCIDSSSGRCYPDIPIGEGFWTLSTGSGLSKQPCKTNSENNFRVLGVLQPCPFFFKWADDKNTKGIIADLEINATNWNTSHTPNLWIGFNHVHAQGNNYVGANSSNDIHINNGSVTAMLESGVFDRKSTDPNADARYVVGINWFSHSLGRGIDLEFNVGNVLKNDGTIQDSWSSTKTIARNEYVEAENLQYIYLGGSSWGLQDISQTNQPQNVTIIWPEIIKRLVNDKILPQSVLDDNEPSVTIIGIEQHGRLHTWLKIGSYHMREFVAN